MAGWSQTVFAEDRSDPVPRGPFLQAGAEHATNGCRPFASAAVAMLAAHTGLSSIPESTDTVPICVSSHPASIINKIRTQHEAISEVAPSIRVLRLYSIKRRTEHRIGNSVTFRRLKSLPETLKSVLTIFAQFPKLDVAGSTPVSRSNFSIIYSSLSPTACSKMLHYITSCAESAGNASSSASTATLRLPTDARVSRPSPSLLSALRT